MDVGLSHAVWLGRLKKCSKKDLGWGSLQKSSSSLSPIPGLPMTTAHPRYVSCHAQEGPAAKCSLTPAEQRGACPRSQAGRYPGRSCKGGLQGVLGLAQRSTETPGRPRSTAHGKMFQLLPCCLSPGCRPRSWMGWPCPSCSSYSQDAFSGKLSSPSLPFLEPGFSLSLSEHWGKLRERLLSKGGIFPFCSPKHPITGSFSSF